MGIFKTINVIDERTKRIENILNEELGFYMTVSENLEAQRDVLRDENTELRQKLEKLEKAQKKPKKATKTSADKKETKATKEKASK